MLCPSLHGKFRQLSARFELFAYIHRLFIGCLVGIRDLMRFSEVARNLSLGPGGTIASQAGGEFLREGRH